MLTIERLDALAPTTPPALSLRMTPDEAAKEFAAAFIAEALSFAGFDKAIESSGGFAAEAMSGFLVREYAEKIVERGGFGVVEMIQSRISQAENLDATR